MTNPTTRKSLLALATLLGVSAGVVAWPEDKAFEATSPVAEPAATPAEGPVNDPCPACGRAFASPQGQEFLGAYTAESNCE
jgi:hypothetical protein